MHLITKHWAADLQNITDRTGSANTFGWVRPAVTTSPTRTVRVGPQRSHVEVEGKCRLPSRAMSSSMDRRSSAAGVRRRRSVLASYPRSSTE